MGDVEERRTRVLSALGDDPSLLRAAPLLNPLTLTDFPDNDFTRELSGEKVANWSVASLASSPPS